MFEEYPPLGIAFGVSYPQQRIEGENAWDSLVSQMTTVFPGRVMYLPVGPAVELHGKFSAWLPPESDPGAPQSSWVRVRMLDDTHFCPAGAALYAGALLSDLTELYHLGTPCGRLVDRTLDEGPVDLQPARGRVPERPSLRRVRGLHGRRSQPAGCMAMLSGVILTLTRTSPARRIG